MSDLGDRSGDPVRDRLDAVYRLESRRVLATLIRLLGDFDLAEEALHDAFRAAIEQWPLQGIGSATSLRHRNGKLSTTDGPFMETNEQLGGFYLVEARDLNEALQIAARIPSVKTGTIEVRPVVDFSKPPQQQSGRKAEKAAAV